MSKNKKTQFEDEFQAAISASLKSITTSEDLRAKILAKLSDEKIGKVPDGVDEKVATEFQTRLSEAVERSQDWAPEDSVVLRTEAALSKEVGRNVLSERSVGALTDGAEVPEALAEVPTSEEKRRFVETVRSEIRRSTGELTAPSQMRDRIIGALDSEAAKSRSRNLIPLPTKKQWKRGLSALTSLAAGFAIVFMTLFSSAEVALASSVRSDHKNCCRATRAKTNTSQLNREAMVESQFGPVPKAPLDGSWNLKVSKVCRSDGNKPMIHLLYNRKNAGGQVETVSFHFVPSSQLKKDQLNLEEARPQKLAEGEFPVVAWLEGDWICTACSPEMTSDELSNLVGALAPPRHTF